MPARQRRASAAARPPDPDKPRRRSARTPPPRPTPSARQAARARAAGVEHELRGATAAAARAAHTVTVGEAALSVAGARMEDERRRVRQEGEDVYVAERAVRDAKHELKGTKERLGVLSRRLDVAARAYADVKRNRVRRERERRERRERSYRRERRSARSSTEGSARRTWRWL